MATPSETFDNLIALLSYINQEVIPNGMREIDGEAVNNVMNALANFIVTYTLNGSQANINSSSGSVVVVSKPITIFTGAPTSVQWVDNVQNEFYFTNATGYDIPFTAGFSYVDQYQDSKTLVPSRTTIHIAKSTNGSWVQVNNIGDGSTDSLPPQTGNQGKSLYTNGNTLYWGSGHWSIVAGIDFENATDCPITEAVNNSLSVYFVDANMFLYEDAGQVEPLPGGGFKILIPGFDALGAFATAKFEVFAKPLNP